MHQCAKCVINVHTNSLSVSHTWWRFSLMCVSCTALPQCLHERKTTITAQISCKIVTPTRNLKLPLQPGGKCCLQPMWHQVTAASRVAAVEMSLLCVNEWWQMINDASHPTLVKSTDVVKVTLSRAAQPAEAVLWFSSRFLPVMRNLSDIRKVPGTWEQRGAN